MNEGSKMGEDALYEVFKSLQVHMRMSDLRTPTKEFVINVFETFLRDLQINLASPLLRPFESISHLENPDLYEEAICYDLLSAAMNHFLSIACPLTTITISDILAPKPKKTKKILNFLIVLWKFVIQKQGLYSQTCNSLQPKIQKLEGISQECENLDSNYRDIVERRNAISTSKEELFQIFAAKEEIFKKHEQTKETIVHEYEKLKEKESQLKTEKVNMDLESATNKEKIHELEQLILSSPDKNKISSDVQSLKNQVKDVEEKILEKEQEKKEKKKENQNKLSSQEDYLVKSFAQSQKRHNDLESIMEPIQSFTKMSENLNEESKELKELQSAHENKDAMTNIFDGKYAKIQNLKNEQKEEINKTIKMLQRKLSEERSHSDSIASSVAESEKTIDNDVDSTVSIVDCLKKCEAETKRRKSLYKEQMLDINNKFRDDCGHILKKVKTICKIK